VLCGAHEPAYSRLRNADQLTLAVLRGGQSTTLSFEIR